MADTRSTPPVVPDLIVVPDQSDVPDTLALALVAASDAPILLLDGDLMVIAASASFSRTFQLDPASVSGHALFSLGTGEWDVPQLRSLLRVTLSGAAEVEGYEMDLKRVGRTPRRLVITAHQLVYGATTDVRLMLSISDVTDARLADRLKDNLLHEKAILYQELQHRIANSLQIIASVLLLKARAVKSEETRRHLRDAHDRVMSVAAVQEHLQQSLGDVEVNDYLTKLCNSLAGSMIRESRPLSLDVSADKALISSRAAVSLGLIVTELVINALKHAFPHGRGGLILVEYRVEPSGWVLSVVDDGVGMPAKGVKVGLGTTVIQALAQQVGAEVAISDAAPGARIALTHRATVAA